MPLAPILLPEIGDDMMMTSVMNHFQRLLPQHILNSVGVDSEVVFFAHKVPVPSIVPPTNSRSICLIDIDIPTPDIPPIRVRPTRSMV